MEPTESAAAGSRLRLRRMAGAWHASRWFGRRGGGAPSPAADARGCAPPATARASAPPPTGRGGPPASHTGQDSAPPPTGQGAPRSSTGHVSAPSTTGHTPAASTTGPVPTRPAGGRRPASRAPGRGPRGRIPGPGAAPSRPGPAPVGTDADGERHLPWPALPSAVVAAASFVLGAGFYRAFTDGQALFPSGTAGWALAVLTGIVVGHLVMLGRSRWWGGTGSGAALTLAVLLLYGWVPAGMVSLTVVVLVGIARRGRWRHGVLHGAVDILGIAAGATLLGVCGSVPSVEEPWDPATWGVYAAPKVVLVAVAYLAVTRALLWYLQTPRAGLPTVARTALVRQGLVAVALLGIAPLVCVVAVAKPLLLPLFAIPLIALDSTLWIARARAEEQLRDPLTGLPNRQWLLERTWTALDDAERIGARAALMLIDLDRFRSVNDTLGHLAGDRLLLQTADRLRQALPRGAEAARLGGDEFAVLLPVADSTTSATRIARGLVGALGSPMDLDGLTLVLEASAGVAVFPDHALDAEGLLRRADVAMYQAKRDRTGVEVYESKRDSNTPDRLGLLGDLRRALDAHEVQLHYQPKVRFDGQVAGLEALVRWVHPERGKVPPDEFIAIAESSGLMPHLTEYVLETALEQVAHWRSQGLFVPVAVNVSPRDVHTPGFAGSVAARLARHGVPAGALQLEITEHVLLEDPQRAADTLNALTGHGVKMSLDDFGTGYSSLVHLRRLPVSELKIDRSFVARLAVDTEDAEIVRCTVDLAHSLGLLVVAEGVEDDETWERLRDLGCDAVQGWLVAAAMPPEETTAWLLARGARGWQRPAAALPAAAADDQGRLG
ncbi:MULTISPECIES: putative bifunctional diguanylate cyclase/phosphodiesterase [Streptomyces]|uniref:putative bifunctional diguanylate cyclase/phosphodiesterase n=3 Tax=Streptomyces TaxID=1883 RepID=UPI001587943E|nr:MULTISPECIES: bifunctional diguanylate cyclase/phosphodiesterase [unclassified Streptomyces]MDI3100889.1 EAL domain-containing protein [Streptomyces sp. AN-3]NUV97023.1 EAL domain-containing protein [Streptomyces sp. KAI 90]WDI20755.1 EAL domain-containing protein [Streptomyces enissocaesilis]